MSSPPSAEYWEETQKRTSAFSGDPLNFPHRNTAFGNVPGGLPRECLPIPPEVNIPERFESFWREPGEKAITEEPETRVPNCSIFHLYKEDHTLGNMLRDRIWQNKCVIFSAYKMEHPLVPKVDLRVQTDGTMTPKEALTKAIKDLITDLGTISREFTKEWELQRVRIEGERFGFGGP